MSREVVEGKMLSSSIILFYICHFSSTFDVVSFLHVSRLSNWLVDLVAKSVISLLNLSSINGGYTALYFE